MNQDTQNTHLKTDNLLVGDPLGIETDKYAEATLVTTWQMVVDDVGLIHGGYAFGLADFTAMIAVNHPNVVLGSADVQFLAPVKIGETLVARATIKEKIKNRRQVEVIVSVGEKMVFRGTFKCIITREHILSMKEKGK